MRGKVLKAVYPAVVLWIVLDVIGLVISIASPQAADAFTANIFIVGTILTVLIGLWAGVLVSRAKGTMLEAGTGGLLVALTDVVFSYIVFSIAGGVPVSEIMTFGWVEIWASIGAAVVGAGIVSKR